MTPEVIYKYILYHLGNTSPLKQYYKKGSYDYLFAAI